MRAALLAGLLTLPAPSSAQEARPWVVILSSGGPRQGDWNGTVESLVRALGGAGVAVLSPGEARTLFLERASAEAAPIDRSAVNEIARVVDSLTLNAAMRRQRAALRDMQELEQLIGPGYESLNREAQTARLIQNGCLQFVRSLLDAGDRVRAREQAMRCVSLVPDLEPDPEQHPPPVIGFLAEVEAELHVTAHASLRIESDTSGCAVYLNGRRQGRTPLDLPSLVPGEYRVQVECEGDEPGRVHRRVLGAEEARIYVDTRLDHAIDGSRLISLRYPDGETEDRSRLGDVRELARTVGASTALAVTPLDGHRARLDRIDVDGGAVVASVLARLEQDLSFGRGQVGRAVEALAAGRSLDVSATPPAPIDVWTAPVSPFAAPAPADRVPVTAPEIAPEDKAGPGAAGWILGAGGVATLGVGWGLYVASAPPNATIAVGISGGALAMVSLPFLLPRSRARVPTWSWLAGLGGVGLAILGAWELQFDGDCSRELPDGRCATVWRSRDLSAVLVSTATPLVAMPFVYLLRGPEPGRAVLTFDVHPGHALVTAMGRF